jgi:parallel beta-helix repeat protein
MLSVQLNLIGLGERKLLKRTVSVIILTLLLISVWTIAPSIRLASASLPVHNIDTGEDFATIQETIDAPNTMDWNHISVDAGTYVENVVLHKSLTLIGENKYSTIIDGNGLDHVVNLKANSTRVTGFTLQNGVSGIFADHTNYHLIENNIVQNNNEGIHLYGSLNNTLSDNLITKNIYGFDIDKSYGNTLRRNEINDNVVYNVYFNLWGSIYGEYFLQDIDASNKVDGKPIYWWTYQYDRQVPKDAGLVVLFSTNDIVIKDLDLTKNNHGIVLLFAHTTIIENVTVHECETGIALHVSHFCSIRGNKIVNNGCGIILEQSQSNNVERNKIENNGNSVIIWGSEGNRIFHNNLYQVYNGEVEPRNAWDDGYPSGGNYWIGYTGTDSNHGTYQNETGSDGIGDTPYIIDSNHQDKYPLMSPYEYWSNPIPGDINKDMKCNYKDLFQLAVFYGVDYMKPNWNPHVDINDDGFINYQDLFLLAINYGKTYP